MKEGERQDERSGGGGEWDRLCRVRYGGMRGNVRRGRGCLEGGGWVLGKGRRGKDVRGRGTEEGGYGQDAAGDVKGRRTGERGRKEAGRRRGGGREKKGEEGKGGVGEEGGG